MGNKLAVWCAVAIVVFWLLVIAVAHGQEPTISYADTNGIGIICNDPKQVFGCYYFNTKTIYMNFALLQPMWHKQYERVYWHEMGHYLFGASEEKAMAYSELMTKASHR
jgi:hypothetical protein